MFGVRDRGKHLDVFMLPEAKGVCEKILGRNKLRWRWASVGPTGQ